MAVQVLTLATLQANALAALRVLFPTRSTAQETFLRKVSDALAGLLWGLHLRVQTASYDATPQDQSSYDALALWAFVFGLSDGAGGYGPKGASVAAGYQGTATGTPGSTILANTQLVANDGTTQFVTSVGAIVGGGGSVTVLLDATTPGVVGNLTAGARLSFISPPAGVDTTVTITVGVGTGAVAGSDKEDKKSLLDRLLYRLQNPPKGGVASDYRLWAEATDGALINRAYIYPRRSMTGAVDLVLTVAGTGTARRPSVGAVALVQAYLATVRPVTVEGLSVLQPYMPGAGGLAIVVRPVPSSSTYAFGFDSSVGGPYEVDTYDAGTKSFGLNANCATLDTAVNTNNQTPYIQVITSGVTLPQQARVVAYDPGTFIATLDVAFDVAPSIGDAVHAGGPMVIPIATSILALVDSLGPSRVSGFASATDVWADTLYIDQIIRVAMEAVDGNGTNVAVSLLATPTIDGAGADRQAADNTSNPPELLYAKSIAVTP